jgi:G1/S-specific cyclin PLC1
MISYIANFSFLVIQCDWSRDSSQSIGLHHSDATPTPSEIAAYSFDPVPSLKNFIGHLVTKSGASVSVVMGALVYLGRLGRIQPRTSSICTIYHQIFLACLILSAKYLNDISPLNRHWAYYSTMRLPSGVFGFTLSDINEMEMSVIGLLNWDLRIMMDELYIVSGPFLVPIRASIMKRYYRIEA